MRYLFIAALSIVSVVEILGQSTLIHLDRPYYSPGQIIFYSISSSFAKQDSCVLLVQCNGEEKRLDHHYVMLRDGEGDGYFQIPFGLPSGIYHLTASVFSQKNISPLEIVSGSISILGETENNLPAIKIASGQSILQHAGFTCSINEREVKIRKTVLCSIEVPNAAPNDKISVAVKDKRLYSTSGFYLQENGSLAKEELLRYIPVVGKRTLINQQPRENAFLFASESKDMIFSFNWVDPNGEFFIKFPPFFGERPLYFVDNGGNTINVALQDHWPSTTTSPALVRSDEAALGLSSFEERKKIYQLFSRLEETISLKETPVRKNLVTPDYNIDVQDYSVRGKLVDLLKEITTPLKFRKAKDDKFTATILYEVLDLKYFYDSDPLFFVNGVATRDFHFIASLPLQDVKSLKLYASLETIRDLKLVDIGGVGVIEMVDPLFTIPQEIRLPSSVVQGLQNPIEYPIMTDVKSPLPLLRSLLYWQPDARLNAEGQLVFEIPCSDDIAAFTIEVVHHRLQSSGGADFNVVFN